MAISVLQSVGAGGASGSSVSSLTTSGVTTTAGSLFLVAVSWDAGATATCALTDSKSNTYGNAIARFLRTTEGQYCQVFVVPNASGGVSHTFTATFSAASIGARMVVMEIAGAATSSPIDQTITNTTATGNPHVIGTITPGNNNEIIIAGGALCGGAGTDTLSVGTGFTTGGTGGAGDYSLFTEYLVQTTATGKSATIVVPSSEPLCSFALSINPASGSGVSQSEPATATDTSSAKFTTPQSVSEAATATSTQSVINLTPAAIVEAATATDTSNCIVTNPTAVIEPASPANSYSTTFPSVENPISESGKWTNGLVAGLDWADVKTTANGARGTQTGAEVHDNDSTAILTGVWGPDQTCSAVVRSINQQTGGIYEEVEFRLRSKITPHFNRGYEINFRCNADGTQYTQIVRWNGAIDDFTYVDTRNSPAFPGIANGDTVSASIIGNLITVKLNGSTIFTATDGTWTDGNPGFGFYLLGGDGTGNLQADFGFTSFSASSAPTDAQSAQSCVVVFAPAIVEAATAASTQSVAATFKPSITETATAADTSSATVTFGASITETASAQSSQDAGNPGVAIVETATATDSVSAVVIYGAVIAEAASATDSPSGSATYPASVAEAANAQSNQDFSGSAVAGVLESATANDVCSAVVIFAVNMTEVAAALDTVSVKATFLATVTESAFASDSASWGSSIQLPTNYAGTVKRSSVYFSTVKRTLVYAGTVGRSF